ncbi:hypothetical protein X777_11935 [Ooceraea biroi]|uniref:Uncharacterized protein n=1 Tax=Ooceraea biroi TaxID=2015173 RepID=A0A026W089_OOCBI|nr:hypothetical protein X777_11935 [Ooceraea biroi]
MTAIPPGPVRLPGSAHTYLRVQSSANTAGVSFRRGAPRQFRDSHAKKSRLPICMNLITEFSFCYGNKRERERGRNIRGYTALL